MSKQLIFVSGIPCSGRSTWINKNLLTQPTGSDGTTQSIVNVDANTFPKLYTNSKLSDESIEGSRQWCLEQVKEHMSRENPTQKIVLSLIACRPDRWREFIQLAIDNQYEISFKFPSNKLLFYTTQHNTSMEQTKFVEARALSRYPRDKKEVRKPGSKNPEDTVMKETNESTLLRYIVTELESAYAFYLGHKMAFGSDKTKWLDRINENYKTAIFGEARKAQKKAEYEAREAEKAARAAEKEVRRLAKEAAEEAKKLAEKEQEEQEEQELDKVEKVIDQEFEEASHSHQVHQVELSA